MVCMRVRVGRGLRVCVGTVSSLSKGALWSRPRDMGAPEIGRCRGKSSLATHLL